MPFKFSYFCELLEELDQQKFQQRATYSRQDDPNYHIVIRWYKRYSDQIDRDETSAIALLSALLPERRPDRTYNLQDKRLTQVFGRALGLGTTRMRQLSAWQSDDGPDFATCVQHVLAESEFDPPRLHNEVTLEEIDYALTKIAANSTSSAPKVRAHANDETPSDVLSVILVRLQSTEAKWLVRMILKSYSPVEIPEYAALYGFHFMLPRLLSIQNSFEAALAVLASPEISRLPFRPSKEYETALLPFVFREIRPKLGVMVRRQALDKARSVSHCVKLAGQRIMSIERKYDGEYCQIHVDASWGTHSLQIFSKSGRDSTQDRSSLLNAIKAGLKLGGPECKIKKQAILEGELLVYSKTKKTILPFYHIRKHVRHGGRRIGSEADSPKKTGEQLMIVFFDILMLDERLTVNEPHKLRRQHLKGLVTPIEGTAMVVERGLINFKSSRSSEALRQAFAAAICKRWEGFVLKGLEDPYFSWKEGARSIKMKKDYIAGLGDTADLCIIGGSRDARIEIDLHLGKLSWTLFYVACLVNKAEVGRFNDKPIFKIVDCIGPGNMSKEDVLVLNNEGKFVCQEFAFQSKFMTVIHPRKDFPPPTNIFTEPIVVELMGAGYERPQTVDFYTLRFPRKATSNIKVHRDRALADTTDFDELQALAAKSVTEQEEINTQEDAQWVERLLRADPKSKYIIEKSQSTSPSKTPHSATTISLSPMAARRASTQPSPSLVRIDSDELTPSEWNERYPSSMPQTPGRKSESMTSRISTEVVAQTKRKLAFVPGSCNDGIRRKQRRVEFAASVGVRDTVSSGPLSEVSNVPVTSQSDGYGHAKVSQGREEEECYDREDTPSKISTDRSKAALEDKRTSKAGLPTPPSTADHIRGRANETSNETEAQTSGATRTVNTTNNRRQLALDPYKIFETIAGPIMTIPHRVQVQSPLLITSSVTANDKAGRHIETHLRDQNVAYTYSDNEFLSKLMDGQLTASYIRKKHIVLVNTANPDEAVTDLHRLAKIAIGNQINEIRDWAKSDILIFDYRILGTDFARWGLKLDFDFANEREAESASFDFNECEKWFCGVLEGKEYAVMNSASRTEVRNGVYLNADLDVQQAFVTRVGERKGRLGQ